MNFDESWTKVGVDQNLSSAEGEEEGDREVILSTYKSIVADNDPRDGNEKK
jgi:hypothetical protein